MATRWLLLLLILPVLLAVSGLLPGGPVQADGQGNLSQARVELLTMVTGDFLRSWQAADETPDSTSPPITPLLSSSHPLPGVRYKRPTSVTGTRSSAHPGHVLHAVFPGRRVYAVGENSNGQLGVGTTSDTNVPQLLPDSGFGGPIAPGLNHTLVVDSGGSLWAAGNDVSGQFGDGSTSSSTMTLAPLANSQVKDVAAGDDHSLLLDDDGILWAAGEGSLGQLGNGLGVDTHTFAPVLISDQVAATAAVRNNSFAIDAEGGLWVFGANFSGELGTGVAGLSTFTPVRTLDSGVLAVSPAVSHTLVLMVDGSVKAMGLNSSGEFGDGTTDSSLVAKTVIGSGVKAIEAGSNFSLFQMADGSLWGAGNNSSGQLGTGDTAVQNNLVEIAADVADFDAGLNHVVYVTDSGQLLGIGSNTSGQLGLGDFSDRLTANSIVGSGVAEVTASYNNTFYQTDTLSSLEIQGLTIGYAGATLNLECIAHWDSGGSTRITARAVWEEDSPSASVELNSGILDLSTTPAGSRIRVTARYFGLTVGKDIDVVAPPAGSRLYGQGDSAYSQLGLDSTVDRPNAQNIAGDDKIIAMAGGLRHSLYVREDGAVFAMGDNTYGQLGTGDTIPETLPAPVTMTGPAIAVGAGDHHSLILLQNGSLWAMGRNDEGQLGTGDTGTMNWSPVRIRSNGVIQANGGGGHSAFLTADGEVWTMGRNLEGQLGDGSTLGSPVPVSPPTQPADVRNIAVGQDHTLLLDGLGGLYGMGSNAFGQLGFGAPTAQQTVPSLMAGPVAEVAAGDDHSLYADQGGNLHATGRNASGQLGTGDNTDRYGFSSVTGATNVSEVFAGGDFSMFRMDGDIYAMGDNSDGQYGNGTFTTSTTPIILPLGQVGLIAPGDGHVLLTQAVAPTVSTVAVSDVTAITASGGGNITADGGSPVTARGVCWSTDPNPTLADDCTSDGSGIGTFTSDITGLLPVTTYQVRAYANKSVGIGYGADVPFTTDDTGSDSDGDGVPSIEEMGPDGTDLLYDGDGNGIPDQIEVGTVSLHSADGVHYVTLAVSGGYSLTIVSAMGNPSPGDSPPNVGFPLGFFTFEVNGLPIGEAFTVTLYPPAGQVIDTYWKYGPTPDNPVPHWYEFLFDGQTGAEINGVAILHFVDGVRGDADRLANGSFLDPGGAGLRFSLAIPVPVPLFGFFQLFFLVLLLALICGRQVNTAAISKITD